MATVQLELDELVDGQDAAEDTVNDALQAVDAIIRLSIKDRDLSTPPGSPAEGDRYFVKPTGTGAWAGHDSEIAVYLNAAWRFFTPREGWCTWIDDEDLFLIWDGTAFVAVSVDTSDFSLVDGSRPFTGTVDIEKATGVYLTFHVTAETEPRAQFSDDRIAFGPGGATAPDTILRRSAANQWTFDDEVRHAADLRINSGFKLVIRDSDDSHQTTITCGNQSANVDYVLPTTAPASDGQVLSCTTAGVMSWISNGTENPTQSNKRVFKPVLPDLTSFSPTEGTAYFVYIGFFAGGTIFKYVVAACISASGGVQTAEMGVFTSPAAPNKAGQTLTKVEATGTITTFANNTVIRNTSAFTTALAADSHVWAAIRTSIGGAAEPSLAAVGFDWSEGAALSTAASGALTASTTFAGSVLTLGSLNVGVAPFLKLELD